ncbi:hypothetical protein [Desulforamulus aquiferis]|uniref:Uncharacterized protein n=1 Tax=Desulforamulus aquiferis TaxID=1397668 RepID=A0AAW7ZDK8_9FIRM|nr:hypothetical protein [Desulforamulus aquiferis]MDO7787793.1 hypothetical protein [Desulforamulus aquiferis]
MKNDDKPRFILREKHEDGSVEATMPLSLGYLREIVRPSQVEGTSFWIEPYEGKVEKEDEEE